MVTVKQYVHTPLLQIGTVTEVSGLVTAVSAIGEQHVLKLGDVVYQDDFISTGEDGHVVIHFNDGSRFDLGRESTAVLDTEVFDPATALTEETGEGELSVEALQAALLEGVDPTQLAEATAAGAPGAGGEAEDSAEQPVVVERDGRLGHVTAGHETGPLGFEYPIVEEEIRPVLEEETLPVEEEVPPPAAEEPPPVEQPPSEEEPPPSEEPPPGEEPPPVIVSLPIANDDTAYVFSGQIINVDLKENDVVGADTPGTWSIGEKGIVSFDATGKQPGVYALPYTLTDANGDVDEATLTVHVLDNPSVSLAHDELGTTTYAIDEDGVATIYVHAEAEEGSHLTILTISGIEDGWTVDTTALPDAIINTEEGSIEIPVTGIVFSSSFKLIPAEDMDLDLSGLSATAYAVADEDPLMTASAEDTAVVQVNAVLDESLVLTGSTLVGTEGFEPQIMELGLNAEEMSPYGQTDGLPLDESESGTAEINIKMLEGMQLGTLVGGNFIPLTSNSFTGTPPEVASWIESLAVKVPAGDYDGTYQGKISLIYRDIPSGDAEASTSDNVHTSETAFTIVIDDVGISIGYTSNVALDETEGVGEFATATGDLRINVGPDGLSSVVLSREGAEQTAEWDPVLNTLYANDGTYKVRVNEDGTYTFTLLTAMDHLPTGNEPADNLVYTFNVLAEDADGSSASGNFTVTVSDDGPMATDRSGRIYNARGESLSSLVYNTNVDGLGEVVLSLDSVTSGGQAHVLTAYGKPISIHPETFENGLGALHAKADINDDGELEPIFSLMPVAGSDDAGSYTMTMHDVIDLPTTLVPVSFGNIEAGGPVTQVKVAENDAPDADFVMLIESVYEGDAVNASNAMGGVVGINDNNMDTTSSNGPGGDDAILYRFGKVTDIINDQGTADTKDDTVSYEIKPGDETVVNDLTFLIKDVGSSTDMIVYQLYKGGNPITIEGGTGTMTIDQLDENGYTTAPIGVDGGFDAIKFIVTSGSFKIGGVGYVDESEPENVLMSFGYTATDADGDMVSGDFDVLICPEPPTISELDETLIHPDHDPELEIV